jgi:hypothetical protein
VICLPYIDAWWRENLFICKDASMHVVWSILNMHYRKLLTALHDFRWWSHSKACSFAPRTDFSLLSQKVVVSIVPTCIDFFLRNADKCKFFGHRLSSQASSLRNARYLASSVGVRLLLPHFFSIFSHSSSMRIVALIATITSAKPSRISILKDFLLLLLP